MWSKYKEREWDAWEGFLFFNIYSFEQIFERSKFKFVGES